MTVTVRLGPDGNRAVVQAQRQLGVLARLGRRGDGLAGGILDERIAALERALGLMGGEREGEPLEVARVLDLLGARRRARLALEHERRGRRVAPGALEPAARARPQLARVLVQAGAVALDVIG